MLNSYDKIKRKKIIKAYMERDKEALEKITGVLPEVLLDFSLMPAWVLANNRCQWRDTKISNWRTKVDKKTGKEIEYHDPDWNQCDSPCYTTRDGYCPQYCFFHRQKRKED